LAAAHVFYEIENQLFTNLATRATYYKVFSKHKNFHGTLQRQTSVPRHTVWETLASGQTGDFYSTLLRIF